MINETHYQTPRTARYFSRESDPKTVDNVWIMFHGYGQSAYHFLLNFKDFNPSNSALIAPEGLSKYYLNGLDGRVGASWMTKENREMEIQDQLHLVDNLLGDLTQKGVLKEGTKLHLLGFSQGAAVACRWYQYTHRKVENLVLWGAGLPIETDAKMAQKYNECNTTIVLGSEDEFIKQERLVQYYQTLADLQFRHNVITYKGGHRMEKEGLEKLKSLLFLENSI
jgi:predicted esterase